MIGRVFQQIRTWIIGRHLRRDLARHKEAADALDKAVREVLGR